MKRTVRCMTMLVALAIVASAFGTANAQNGPNGQNGPGPELDPNLKRLEWHLGQWIHRSQTEEGKPLVVKRVCAASLGGHYLAARTQIQVDGQVVLKHEHRVRWDPVQEKYHAWVFSSNGDFAHGHWEQIATRDYRGEMSGQTLDGKGKTATASYTLVDGNTYIYRLRDRTTGGVSLADIEWDFHRVNAQQ